MKKSNFLSEYGALVALVVLFIYNVIRHGSTFLQAENLRNLVSQNASVGVIAIGMTLVIIAGGIDLSVGSLTAMCGAVCILVVNKFGGSGMVEKSGRKFLRWVISDSAVLRFRLRKTHLADQFCSTGVRSPLS